MAKKPKNSVLVCNRSDRCIGCKLCVIQSCILKQTPISFAKSFIKVSKKEDGSFSVTIDYGTKTNYQEIVDICPRRCFEIMQN